MNTLAPISENRTVALPAQAVTLVETDQRPVGKTKSVPIVNIVAIETPSFFWSMIEHYIVVHILEHTAFDLRLHIRMTIRTRKNVFGKRWRRHLERICRPIKASGIKLIDRRVVPLDLGKIFRRKRLEPTTLMTLDVAATLDDQQDGHQSDPGKKNQKNDQRRGLRKNIPVTRIRLGFAKILILIRNNQPPSLSHQNSSAIT